MAPYYSLSPLKVKSKQGIAHDSPHQQSLNRSECFVDIAKFMKTAETKDLNL